jgi:hypothetical protein
VLTSSRIPPAASIFAKRTNGLVIASMGRVALRATSTSFAIIHLKHGHHFLRKL